MFKAIFSLFWLLNQKRQNTVNSTQHILGNGPKDPGGMRMFTRVVEVYRWQGVRFFNQKNLKLRSLNFYCSNFQLSVVFLFFGPNARLDFLSVTFENDPQLLLRILCEINTLFAVGKTSFSFDMQSFSSGCFLTAFKCRGIMQFNLY